MDAVAAEAPPPYSPSMDAGSAFSLSTSLCPLRPVTSSVVAVVARAVLPTTAPAVAAYPQSPRKDARCPPLTLPPRRHVFFRRARPPPPLVTGRAGRHRVLIHGFLPSLALRLLRCD